MKLNLGLIHWIEVKKRSRRPKPRDLYYTKGIVSIRVTHPFTEEEGKSVNSPFQRLTQLHLL
jgi:hypothetical protein